MKNTKLMLIAVCAVFAIAGFAAGCDEGATVCETDEDCDTEAGETCDIAEGECQVPCALDTDCTDEEAPLCCPDAGDVKTQCKASCDEGTGGTGGTGGSGGGDVCPAGEGLSQTDNECHPECTEVADCYDFSAYCASDSLCYSVDAFATCTRVAGKTMDADGPLIFDPGQDTIGSVAGNLCTKVPATCPNNGNVCQFSFQFYDPNDDVASSHNDLFSKIRFVKADGTLIDSYDVVARDGSTLAFMGCFGETETSPAPAAVLLDNAGNQSNPLCFLGSAP